jgi:hypothetical protein
MQVARCNEPPLALRDPFFGDSSYRPKIGGAYMDAVDYVIGSDAVIISSLQYSVSDDQRQIQQPAPLNVFHLCPRKTPGQLFLVFNIADLAQQLGYSVPLTDDAVFVGTRVAPDRIEWKLDQVVDRKVAVSGHDVTIDTMSGSLSTEVDPLAMATKEPGCDGYDRFAEYTLRTVPGTTNLLDIKVTVHTNTALGDVDDIVHITNISFAAWVCKALDPRVRIGIPHNECSMLLSVVEGRTVRMRAELTNPPDVPQGAQLQTEWDWKVVGAVWRPGIVAGLGTVSSIDVDLPSPPHQVAVTVTVTMTIPGLTLQTSDTTLIGPTPAQYVKLIELACRTRQELIVHPFIDPLGDPPRDLTIRPISLPELNGMKRWADRLVGIGRSLQTETERLLAGVEDG